MVLIISSINLHSLSVAIWFKLLRNQAVPEASFELAFSEMSVSIGDYVLTIGEGIYMDAGDDSGETTEKLIVNINVDAENEADLFARVCDFLDNNNCHSGKIYVGRNLDVMLIIYLDNLLNDTRSMAAELEQAFPEARRFRPLNSMDSYDGIVWVGVSNNADSPAYCLI